ncbi:SDR family oxidoreductase [Tenacibaculum sp. 190524A02b]|uniref:Epimerase n=1 Tax=Tenacibaculum vairaonense TaxID=3137860 RepID=A0ABM9PLD6_9FLAO
MKKIIVFGATGSVGKLVVQQLLEKGYEVTAFCRSSVKLAAVRNKNLKIVVGDVLTIEDVNKALKNQEVVIVTLGAGKNRKSKVRSQGTKNILEGMKNNNLKRIICQTTLGAGASTHNLNFFWKRIMFGWFLKQVFLDHELQEYYVQNSGLEWTIARPSAFIDNEEIKSYQHGFSPLIKTLKLKISRANVADFLIKQIENKNYLYKTPGVSY